MNNATEACRMYVERIKELEALLAAGTLEHDNRICDMHDINTRMQAKIDDLEARNAELERDLTKLRALAHYGDKSGIAREIETQHVAELTARAEAAEARAKVLEEALEDVAIYHQGERTCSLSYLGEEKTECNCHVGIARQALQSARRGTEGGE